MTTRIILLLLITGLVMACATAEGHCDPPQILSISQEDGKAVPDMEVRGQLLALEQAMSNYCTCEPHMCEQESKRLQRTWKMLRVKNVLPVIIQ